MRLASPSDVGEFRGRFKWYALAVVVTFAVVIGRLFDLQVIEADRYREEARENIIRRVSLPAARGVVEDANGKVLASNRAAWNVAVVPGRVLPSGRPPHRVGRYEVDTWASIADALRLTPAERDTWAVKLRDACKTDEDHSACWRSVMVREDAPRDVVAELRQHPQEYQGVEVIESSVRTYPFGSLTAHLMGYVGEIDAETLVKHRPEGYGELPLDEQRKLNPLGYEPGDTVGVVGLERAWEAMLRGQRGWIKRIVDARGRYRTEPAYQSLLEEPSRQDPIAGRNLRLSIDVDLQRSTKDAMAKQLAGAVVAMEVRTGRILALYSKPEFDPNEVSGAQGRARLREAFGRLRTDPLNPLLDKTTTGAFPPGSTFKPFAALAGLEEDAFRPEKNEVCNQFVFYGKRRFKCTHMHGVVNLRSAIAQSCNIYFFKLAEAVGIDRFARLGQLFGFGERTGLAINPESPGRMPTRAYYTNLFRGSYKIGFSLNTAIGQGAMTTTPVQLAAAYAALGNGGTLYVPQVVRSVVSSDGELLQEFNPRVRRTIPLKPQNLARILDGLKQVVDSTHGTAHALRDPALPVAGKTGTAQVGYAAHPGDDPKWAWYYSRDDAWFAALYPSQAPELALVVLVEHGASGPAVAAPIAFQILHDYAQFNAKRRGSVH